MLKKTGILAACLVLSSSILRAQPRPATFDPDLAATLQAVVSQERATQQLRGVSAAVIVPGQGLWQGVSGLSSSRAEDVITPDMQFGIASIKKTFTAALILKLAEERRLSLDDSLHRWLPALQHVDSILTIRHLLSHTSGVYNITDHPAFWTTLWADPDSSWSPEEVLAHFVDPPVFAAGSRFGYSNTNYLLLNMVARAVTGSAVSTEFRERFWDPLNLTGTFLAAEEVVTGDVAHNWGDRNGDGRLEDLTSVTGASTHTMLWPFVYSTAADLARWAEALYGGQVLDAASLEAMMQVTPVYYYPSWTGYGLGAMRFILQGEVLWGHSGSVPGYRTIALYWPAGGVGLSVLVNQDGFESVHTIASRLLDAVKAFQASATSADAARETPGGFVVHPGYPNPFIESTTITFELPRAEHVTVEVFDVYGRAVATLAEGLYPAGRHALRWTATGVASGVYLCRVQAGAASKAQTVIVRR